MTPKLEPVTVEGEAIVQDSADLTLFPSGVGQIDPPPLVVFRVVLIYSLD